MPHVINLKPRLSTFFTLIDRKELLGNSLPHNFLLNLDDGEARVGREVKLRAWGVVSLVAAFQELHDHKVGFHNLQQLLHLETHTSFSNSVDGRSENASPDEGNEVAYNLTLEGGSAAEVTVQPAWMLSIFWIPCPGRLCAVNSSNTPLCQAGPRRPLFHMSLSPHSSHFITDKSTCCYAEVSHSFPKWQCNFYQQLQRICYQGNCQEVTQHTACPSACHCLPSSPFLNPYFESALGVA